MLKNCDCFCASLWRQGHVVKTAMTLLSQPECRTMTITCNNWTDSQWSWVNTQLKDDRVILVRGDNAKGSNGKLEYLHTCNGEYILLFDDDILYPSDYLHYLIAGCERHRAHVSLHGVILNKGLIQSYYRDRQVFRGLGSVYGDVQVDIASNCGSLWRRDFFADYSEWYNQCGTVSCDDIYVAIHMKNQGINRWVLDHREGYIVHKQQLPEDDYVFNRHALVPNGDVFQTTLINSFYKKS